MATVLSKLGKPLPYRLESRGNPLRQHAIIKCCECEKEDAFIYQQLHNPQFVCQKFIRRGWEIYRSGRSRCPEHKAKQAQRKAIFARRDEMQTTPKIGLVKAAEVKTQVIQTKEEPQAQSDRQAYLVVIENGIPTIKSIADAQEMLFGNRTYLVIPLEE